LRSDHAEYRLENSIDRINKATAPEDNLFEERESIPPLNSLTYTNGFYVKCTVLFVDIRWPPEMQDFYGNICLSKLYRAYVSEVAAVMNGSKKCAEINVVGDHVFGVFDTPFTEDVDEVFSTGGKISSIIDILNCKFKKDNPNEAKIGIGIAYGRALLMKAGYKGSSISETIWMGDAIDEASRLASYGNKEPTDKEMMVSEITYYNLSEENQKLLTSNSERNCFHGNIMNSYMNNWYKQNCP